MGFTSRGEVHHQERHAEAGGVRAHDVAAAAGFEVDPALAFRERRAHQLDVEGAGVGGEAAGELEVAAHPLFRPAEARLAEEKLDLVIIAFGMNDVWRKDAAAFKTNIKAMIDAFRESQPETEFILVSTMLGNENWGMPMDQFYSYREALRELTGSGIVLVDLTEVWETLLKRKTFYDLTGNGVNHPNDFGHIIYAQWICRMLLDDSAYQ